MDRLPRKAHQRRNRHRRLSLCVAALFSAAQPSVAAQTDTIITAISATELHRTGQYEQAILTGRAEGTFDGLVAAAKSGLFLAAYAEKSKKRARKLLAEATQDAKAAVAMKPDDVDANLQLSIAEGYYARIKTSPKRAKKSRERAERLVAIDPDNGYVLGLLGGWHGEAIAAYGKLIADITVGADVDKFERYFDAALTAAPNNALITAYYVRLLLDIDDPGMREKARLLLRDIEAAQPEDAFEIFMKDRAMALKAALDAGETKTLKRLIKAQRPFRDQK